VYAEGEEAGKLIVGYCLDDDGTLLALERLDQYTRDRYDCLNTHLNVFFDRDSIVVLPRTSGGGHSLFDYTTIIYPPFHIGDTSTVHYRLKAMDNISGPLATMIYSEGFQVVSEPISLSYPIDKDDTVDWLIRLVPLTVKEILSVRVNFEDRRRPSGERRRCNLHLNCTFNDNGSLNLLSDLWMNDLDSSFLPESFRPMQQGDSYQIVIPPDSTEAIWRQY